MTVLEKRIFKENVHFKKHEAPIHNSDSSKRLVWKYEEVPFFSSDIIQLWNIYQTSFSDIDSVVLNKDEVIRERSDFIKNVIYTASVDDTVVGGLWQNTLGNNLYQLHIKFLREHRNLAHPFFAYYLDSVSNKKPNLIVHWGARDKIDDPSNFLRRFGFDVCQYKNCSGSASYRFE